MPGQQVTEEKSNEITATPYCLQHLDLKGALVTMMLGHSWSNAVQMLW
jgi:hypothetical protein